MILEKEIKACVERLAERSNWEWTAQTVCLLNGVWNLYEANGCESCRAIVRNAMDQLIKEVEEKRPEELSFAMVGSGRLLFPLYRENPKEAYHKTAEVLWAWLQEQAWQEKDEAGWAKALYLLEPFYLEYENQFHAKERYHHIQEQLKKAFMLLDQSSQKLNEENQGWYLMAMIDCCGLISEEVFDHYKNAERYMKAGLRQAAELETPPAAYARLKGCRLGVLLEEKYLEHGIKLLEKTDIKMTEDTGMLLMAYGELLKICPEGEKQ